VDHNCPEHRFMKNSIHELSVSLRKRISPLPGALLKASLFLTTSRSPLKEVRGKTRKRTTHHASIRRGTRTRSTSSLWDRCNNGALCSLLDWGGGGALWLRMAIDPKIKCYHLRHRLVNCSGVLSPSRLSTRATASLPLDDISLPSRGDHTVPASAY